MAEPASQREQDDAGCADPQQMTRDDVDPQQVTIEEAAPSERQQQATIEEPGKAGSEAERVDPQQVTFEEAAPSERQQQATIEEPGKAGSEAERVDPQQVTIEEAAPAGRQRQVMIEEPEGRPSEAPTWSSEYDEMPMPRPRGSIASSMMSGSSPAKMYFRAVVNIVLSLTGVGLLSLPSGVAVFAKSDDDFYIALGFSIAVLIMSGYCFYIIGMVCETTNTAGYCAAWHATVKRGTAIPMGVMITAIWVCGVTYFMVQGDAMASLLSHLGNYSRDTWSWTIARGACIVGTAAIMYPIVIQKNFRRMMHFTLLGNVASFSVVLMILVRYADGSYEPGGRYGDFQLEAAAKAKEASSDSLPQLKIMVLVSQLANAFMAHQASAEICRELPVFTDEDATKKKARAWALVVLAGFTGGGLLNIGCMALGYKVFGQASQGNILESFHRHDRLGQAGQVLVALAVVTCFPLIFKPQRDVFLTLIGSSDKQKCKFRLVTIAQLAANAIPAVLFQNLGVVNALIGAIWINFLMYIAPGLMDALLARTHKIKKCLDLFLVIFGILAMISGCTAIVVAYI